MLFMLLTLALFTSVASPASAKSASKDIVRFEEALPKVNSIAVHDYRINLINLNPYINRWFVLEFVGKKRYRIHLDNRDANNHVFLSQTGIVLQKIDNPTMTTNCPLWKTKKEHLLTIRFNEFKNPYFPVCNGLVYLRLKRSSKTKLSLTEWTTEMLRTTDFGEDIINSVKPMLVSLNAESAEQKLIENKEDTQKQKLKIGPATAKTHLASTELPLVSSEHNLGFTRKLNESPLYYGHWYQTHMHTGIYTGLFIPDLIHPNIKKANPRKVFPIIDDEKDKLIYLTAYDLSEFTLRYTVGTTEPPINTEKQNYGIVGGLRKSLVPIGSIPPYHLSKAVGVFVGGFKRRHSMILHGPHKGKKYGYIEKGVELSPMAPGLATLSINKSGQIKIDRWPENIEERKEARKETISARQNGVMLIHNYEPGPLVNSWSHGNWSADANGVRQSLRSGVCIQEHEGKRHLIFMAFTSVTPSTMVRVMQSYSCKYGMHLDMNAHMYLHNAIYEIKPDKSFKVEYLNKEMLYPPGLKRHRFILDNNSRDFFYIMKKEDNSGEAFAKYEDTLEDMTE
ncbi:MAG: hypothetical protein HRU09_09365 [Oligoflexales bacterium]|nr:hypothetical protein [Oligoflexales bacterium]